MNVFPREGRTIFPAAQSLALTCPELAKRKW
jgi:hypothetical protein